MTHGAEAAGPPSARRERNADATKARLLAAAESEFAAKGFDGARLGNIAKAAGVQQALIHHYFADKEGLYREVLARGLALVTHESWDILARFASPAAAKKARAAATSEPALGNLRDITAAFVDVLVRFFSEHAAFLAILRHEGQPGEEGSAVAPAAEALRKSARPVVLALVRRIEEMKAAGEVRKDLDARHLCVSVMAMACFPLQESRMLSAFWSIDWHSPAVLEARKREIVAMVLARAAP